MRKLFYIKSFLRGLATTSLLTMTCATTATLLLSAITPANASTALPWQSQHALLIDADSGAVILEKNAGSEVPIASLTKLMTAMVTLDAKQDMEETILIESEDVDRLKHSSSRVPVGTALPRKTVLHLALMSSDNRAAASLARTYPGGNTEFIKSIHAKLQKLGMTHTRIEEPTGLSPNNTSTAFDLSKMAEAASKYPEIINATTDSGEEFDLNGHAVQYHNTNKLVGKSGWDINLSKTGYTKEAGRCIIMKMRTAGKKVILVLLNASESTGRTLDAINVRRYLEGQTTYLSPTVHVRAHKFSGRPHPLARNVSPGHRAERHSKKRHAAHKVHQASA
jgi:D-alanyl-D-alanine endopeptidase (penicillin-binding protein 7)